MKIQRTLLTTIGLLSSAVVWAADPQDLLFISGNETGRWTNTVNVAKGYPQVVTTDVATDEILDGALTYRINHPGYKGYDFTIKAQANEGVNSCNLNGNSHLLHLDGAGTGPRIYEISAEGMVENNILSCTVTVVDKGENLGHMPPQPQLILEHDHYLEVGYQACTNGKKTPVAIKTVKPFKIKEKNYLALIVNEVALKQETCINDSAKAVGGVHIFEWNTNTKKYEHIQFINQGHVTYSFNVAAIELFAAELNNSNFYLAIGVNPNAGTSGQVDIWRWEGEGQGFQLDPTESTPLGKNLTNLVVTDLKYSQQIGHLIVTNGGGKDIGYNRYAYAYKKNTNTGKFDSDPAIYFPTYSAQAVEIFNDSSNNVLFFANKNNAMSYNIDSSGWIFDSSKQGGYKYKPEEMSTGALTYGAVHVEHFNMDSNNYLLMANTKSAIDVQSALYYWDPAKKQVVHVDKIDASGATKWMHLNLDGQNYFFAGFASTPNASTYQIYGWCTGKEAESHWCKTAQPQSNNVRYYAKGEFVPNGSDSGTFTSSGWEQVTIDGQLYLLRYDSTINGNGDGVQLLKPSVDFK